MVFLLYNRSIPGSSLKFCNRPPTPHQHHTSDNLRGRLHTSLTRTSCVKWIPWSCTSHLLHILHNQNHRQSIYLKRRQSLNLSMTTLHEKLGWITIRGEASIRLPPPPCSRSGPRSDASAWNGIRNDDVHACHDSSENGRS